MHAKERIRALRGLIEKGMDQPLREAVILLLDDYAARAFPSVGVPVAVPEVPTKPEGAKQNV